MCNSTLDRRRFLRLTAGAVAGGLAGSLLGCRRSATRGEVRIAVRTSNCQAAFFAAEARRLYAGVDASISLLTAPSNTEIVEALSRGDVQLGSIPITTAIAAMAGGAPLHIVAMAGRGSDGLLVRAEDGPHDLEGLRGGRVAIISGSILDVLLRHALERSGLDPQAHVDAVPMGALGDMIAALRTHQILAASHTEPFMTEAEHLGWGRVLHRYTQDWPDHPCCVVVADTRWADDHPDTLAALLEVHREATAWADAHHRETAGILVERLGVLDADLVAASLDPSRMRLDASLGAEDIGRMAGLMLSYGLIERLPASVTPAAASARPGALLAGGRSLL